MTEHATIKNFDAIAKFWKQELAALSERNRKLAAEHITKTEEIARRQTKRTNIVFTCMDERTALVEDALGLIPGEALVHASGGARLNIESFERIFGGALAEAEKSGRAAAVYLVTHEAANEPDKGCAAFSNDVPAQTAYFTALKEEIGKRHPATYVHVIMLDSTAYGLKPISVDERDEAGAAAIKNGGALKFHAAETAHAGYGIYIGDCYRAWVPEHNLYFRLTALNPDLAGDVGIALKVMGHHSTVDLSSKPIVMHADYPRYEDAEKTDAAWLNIDGALEKILADDQVKAGLSGGSMRLIKSQTDARTWQGEIVK
ncbi:MAG: hypothetical protein PHT12_06650 [Patescibacteria group bacterium]|nr:hypothetical protein [Patescibacteria group bacterium]